MFLPFLNNTKKPSVKSSKLRWIPVIVVLIILSAWTNTLKHLFELQEEVQELKLKVESQSSVVNEINKEWFEKEKPLLTEFPSLSQRNDIIGILQKLGWKTAIEVGVQKGLFAKKMMDNWPACTEYKLVDLWGLEERYEEPGDHSTKFHKMALRETERRVAPYKEKVEFFKMRSTDAAKLIQDNHFDFVYLDARHDYCAVAEDIQYYWPKVRPGGILAGHDFVDAQYAIDRLGEIENWGICEDGTKQPRAVRGAVEDFAKMENIDFILVSQEGFPSWFIQKPY